MRKKWCLYFMSILLILSLAAGSSFADNAVRFSSIMPAYCGGTVYIGGRVQVASSGEVTLYVYRPGEDTVWIEKTLTVQPDGSFSYPMKTLPDVEGEYKITVECDFGSDSTAVPVKKREQKLSAAKPDEVSVVIDGTKIEFDVPPQIINDRVMVPMRKIFESLGAGIAWDEERGTVTAERENDVILLAIGSQTAVINGVEQTLDQPAVIQNDRTLVPIRFVSEALHRRVQWIENTLTVEITQE